MFPSSGLFSAIQCPVLQHGLCDRPHCFYKHATEVRNMFGTPYKPSIVDSAGVQHGYLYTVCGSSVNEEISDDCLKELDRLNKEIESVRHEVEQEQRRLSHYQTVQTETACKNIDGASCPLSSSTDFTKNYSKTRKYIVDNSKPRTDLEYDPLSNFSANLRSNSLSGCKDQKNTKGQGLKRAKDPLPFDLKKLENQTRLSTSLSSELLEDSNEDDVLIIDIPPSPEKKRGRTQMFADFVFPIPQNNVEELEIEKEPAILESLLCTSVDEVFNSPRTKKNQALIEFYENKESANGSTVCIENQEAENHKSNFQVATTKYNSPEPASLSVTKDNYWKNVKDENLFQGESTQCKLSPSVGIMKPCDFSQAHSIFCSPPLANSGTPSKQPISQVQTEKPVQNKVGEQSSSKNPMPLLEMDSQGSLIKMQRHMQDNFVTNQTSNVQYQEQSELSVHSPLTTTTEPGPSQQPFFRGGDKEVITIESSSDDEDLSYLEMELSDSDPMEECYRIFMEANNENKDVDEKSDVSVEGIDLDTSNMSVKSPSLPARKRVAHEAKHSEMVVKGRPQPQVLVPLCGPTVSGLPSQPSKVQQPQQRAPILTGSVKVGQACVTSACQKKPEIQKTQVLESLQPAPLQNAYMNYIPLGTAVINMGNNLHLILPEGTFPLPVASTCSPVTPVLTPISQVHTSALTVKQAYLPPAVPTMQKYRTAAPMIIPAPAREPSLNASLQSYPPTVLSNTAKPVPGKRKLKQQCDAAKEKVPHDVRQRYVNMFTKEFIKTTANVNDAFEKALAEERNVYSRSINKLKYLSIAVNALKRLKNQGAVVAKDKTQVGNLKSKGTIPLNLQTLNTDDAAIYESLTDYILTEEKLIENNYPVKHPEKPGCATLFAEHKKGIADPLKRICCRCGATYSVNQTGRHIRKEECNYHYGKGVENRVPGGVETRYSCCEGVMGAPGCQVFKLHVHDSLSLDGFVSTIPRQLTDTRCPGVYSLDCEMCYTIHGLELSRVTVVNSSLQVIYDTFVRPADVIDYNTRFSGITEEDVKSNYTSLREVQETLLSFINAETILIGHSLETDLCALKLLHGTVVDTSVVFPHRLGPPHKLTLHNLTAEYLRRIIQESVCGHDTAEEAAACMELMLWKVKEDGKSKKITL